MSKVANYIWVTTSFEGFHKYTGAPTEVSFLRNTHRHIFHLKVYIQVYHNDREIEFILFKRYIQNLTGIILDLNYKSCEMISDELYNKIIADYPGRVIIIEVSEDGENGSRKEYIPTYEK